MIPVSVPFVDQGRAIDNAIGTLRRRRARLSPGDAATLAGLEAARVVNARLSDVAAATSDVDVEDLLARASSAARANPGSRSAEIAA